MCAAHLLDWLRQFPVLQVANLARNFSNEAPNPYLGDGAWHMLTLTSQPDGSMGYRMYIDGALSGQLNGNQSYVGKHHVSHVLKRSLHSIIRHKMLSVGTEAVASTRLC